MNLRTVILILVLLPVVVVGGLAAIGVPMNAAIVAVLGGAMIYLAYTLYARRIDREVIRPDPKKATPAKMYMDGVDFMPTSRSVLYGYHFKSIAAAGPIVGVIAAANLWGWLPSILWLILGVSFIGWASDYSAIMVAVRNDGNSLSAIAHRLIAPRTRLILFVFIFFYLLLIGGAFVGILAGILDPRADVPFGILMLAVMGLLAGQEAHDGEHQDAEGHVGPRVENAGEDPDERPADQQEVEEDEDEEDQAGARRDEPVGDGRQGIAVVTHRDHDRGVVARPADEGDPEDEPQDGRQPAPQVGGGDHTNNRAGRGDRFEVIAVQHTPIGRHEVHAVHVHPRRGGLLRVRAHHVAVDAPRIERVGEIDHHPAEHGHDGRVHRKVGERDAADHDHGDEHQDQDNRPDIHADPLVCAASRRSMSMVARSNCAPTLRSL